MPFPSAILPRRRYAAKESRQKITAVAATISSRNAQKPSAPCLLICTKERKVNTEYPPCSFFATGAPSFMAPYSASGWLIRIQEKNGRKSRSDAATHRINTIKDARFCGAVLSPARPLCSDKAVK